MVPLRVDPRVVEGLAPRHTTRSHANLHLLGERPTVPVIGDYERVAYHLDRGGLHLIVKKWQALPVDGTKRVRPRA